MGIDAQINEFFQPISDRAFSIVFYSFPFAGQDVKLILLWLVAAGVFFTFYLGFINFRFFRHAVDVAMGKYDVDTDDGRISSFQALMTSMSGTVGLGNIAGVALAVSVGGPGAVLWMMIMAFFGMSTKFAEVTLGVKYRVHASKEHAKKISGGPMYYLRDGFKELGYPTIGKIMAVFFAVCCLLGGVGGGNMFQANQTFQQFYNITGGDAGMLAGKGWLFGIVLAGLVGAVILGGLKSIASVSSKLVPLMGIVYVAAGFTVIGIHFHDIIPSFVIIFQSAFSPEAGMGAVLGTLLVGAQRAAFSNEAGLGTAPIVYAAARAHHPITQGMASMLGPFIDTIIICTITGLLIVISGAYQDSQGMEGIALTSRALESGVSWFPHVLTISVFLFAYSTMIAFYYTAVKCLTFLTGESDKVEMIFKIVYCVCIVIGASVKLDNLINFTDAMFLSMAFPNIIGLYFLAPSIKRDLKDYTEKFKAQGRV